MPKVGFSRENKDRSGDTQVLCTECGGNYHAAKFTMCWSCKNGDTRVRRVICSRCRKNEHPAEYEYCISCSRKSRV